MKKQLKFVIPLIIFTLIGCSTVVQLNQNAETILMDITYLQTSKERIQNNDPNLRAAYNQLIKEAETALKEGPYTVTDKEKLPPSGDKHDYASYSRYWWPDPSQSKGLPYIRRDGETNPLSQSLKESDRQRIGALGINTETLGLAYYFTGEEKYASKAAELIRVWFLNPETRMNPNVNHAQCRPGHNLGSKSGVLDGRLLIQALEGSKLILNSSTLNKEDYKGLKEWAGQYFEWLTTNKMALEEEASNNNHGSFYDVQAMYFALYSENSKSATRIAQKFARNRITSQIKPDGSMPEEMARTRPLFYSIYNLHAMFLVARLAEKVDVDAWKSADEESPLRMALDYLVPYADVNTAWPSPTISKADRMELFSILKMAEGVYPMENYSKVIDKLPIERREIHRANLALPLMR